jgi:aerotaxis receptor
MLMPLQEMQDDQVELMESFEAIRGIPSNMRIVASRLEPAGGPISAISQNYRLMSDEVTAQLSGFYVKGTTVPLPTAALSHIENVMVYGGATKLSEEIQLSIGAKTPAEVNASDDDIGELIKQYKSASRVGLLDLSHQVERLARSSKDVRQLVTGLDSIRVLCRVEAGRLGSESAALLPVIDQLDKFHKKIDTTLERISYTAGRVSDMIEMLRRS